MVAAALNMALFGVLDTEAAELRTVAAALDTGVVDLNTSFVPKDTGVHVLAATIAYEDDTQATASAVVAAIRTIQ